ncbi:MAG: hypothetical protein J6A27_06735 [Bacteroidales bacterium]|nr:hypothetical protein [Bacteroidales bacterium]
MRRKRIRHLLMPPAVILILVMFVITACEADFLDSTENQQFSLQQAKEYSLQNSTNFKMPSSAPLSKSRSYSGVEYEPLWENAKYHEIRFPDKIARTYEVPLKMDAGIGGILLKNGNHASEAAKMSSSLIIQEFEQGDKRTRRQIMATIVGNDSGGNTSSAAFSYMGSRETFTGFMIVSTVSGKILNIFQYINGERTVMYLKTDDSESPAGYYKGIRFVKSLTTRAAGGGTIFGVCYMCGKTGDVYPDYGHICAECLDESEFLDDVLVDGEWPKGDEGGGSGCTCTGGNCNCLSTGSLICTCTPEDNPGTGCSYCHLLGCNGECQTGGGGNGNSNNSSSSLNINWTNNTSFNATFQNVLDTENSLVDEIIANVEDANIEIELSFSDTLRLIAAGVFSLNNAFAGNPYKIIFSYDFNSLNPAIQKVIIYHEILHLNIYAMLKGASASTIETAIPGMNYCYSLWGNDQNEMQHEFFARNYLSQIADMIRTVAPNLDAEKAKWGSLTRTKEFENLDIDNQVSIIEYLKNNNLY